MPRTQKNDIGAGWKKSNERGDFISISLDIDALLDLTGGHVGKVNLHLFPIDMEKLNANAPDYRLKYYPREGGGRATRVERRAPEPEPDDKLPDLTDDDIPF